MSSNLHGLGGGAAMVVAPKPQALKAKPRSERVPIEQDMERVVEIVLRVASHSNNTALAAHAKALKTGERTTIIVVAATKLALVEANLMLDRAVLAEFINRVERPAAPVSCRENWDCAPRHEHLAIIKRVIGRVIVPAGEDRSEHIAKAHKNPDAFAALVRLVLRGACGRRDADAVWEYLIVHFSKEIYRADRDSWNVFNGTPGPDLVPQWFAATEEQRELARDALAGDLKVLFENVASQLTPVELIALCQQFLPRDGE